METIDTVDTIELTEDMVGDLFMTREGKVVCLEEWDESRAPYPAVFSDGTKTIIGKFYGNSISFSDITKHLTRSKYPEYFL